MKSWFQTLLVAVAMISGGLRQTSAAPNARPDLTGRVLRADQSPVPNAMVFIYTAGPRTGTAVVCPSCYPDCGKQTKTDAAGAFEIPSLDPALLFRLLVIAPGYESQYVPKTDPLKGPTTVTLAALDPAKLKAPTRICGVVLDGEGKAVPGVTLSPEGVALGSSTRWGGTDAFVDPLAVSDEHGRFWLYCTNGVDRVHAVAEGRGLAKRWVEFKPGQDHLIRMEEGVVVTGRIEREGQPLRDVVVGAVTTERAAGNFFRCEELATDRDGGFVMANVPPGREFALYATMDSLRGRGAVLPKVFTTGKSGEVLKLGVLAAKPGHQVSGRVVLSDEKPVPANTRLFFGRDQAWDHTEATLDADGRFTFTDVPSGGVSVSVRIQGYKFSKRNRSLDWLNGGLVGRVGGDLAGLEFLMEPGDWRYNGEEGEAPGGESQPREKPLRGAE